MCISSRVYIKSPVNYESSIVICWIFFFFVHVTRGIHLPHL